MHFSTGVTSATTTGHIAVAGVAGCLAASYLSVLHLAGLAVAVAGIWLHITTRAELERSKFLLEAERESGAILSKELELMLSAKSARSDSMSPKEGRIGAFWTPPVSAAPETQEERELRVAQYLEEVGGVVVHQDQLKVWFRSEAKLQRLLRDVAKVSDTLSRSLSPNGAGKSKTEAINEALFILQA